MSYIFCRCGLDEYFVRLTQTLAINVLLPAMGASSGPERSTSRRPGHGRNRRTTPSWRHVYSPDAAAAGPSTVAYYEQNDWYRSTQRRARSQSSALPTLPPNARRGFVFYGDAWLMYELQGLPADYRGSSTNEQIRIRFQTDSPNGLLWYIGSDDRSTHLSLKVG